MSKENAMSPFTKFKVKPKPLSAVLIGTQGTGKTTTCGSLLQVPTLLLYVSALEGHAVNNMAKGAALYEGASADNLFPVAIDTVEEPDLGILEFCKKLPVGSKLNADQALMKLHTYLQLAKGNVQAVVVDSLTALSFLFSASQKWKNRCMSDKGLHSGFKESDAHVEMFQEIIGVMTTLNDAGIHTVCTCGAKLVEADSVSGDVEKISPELPAYRVAERIIYAFADIIPLARNTQFPPWKCMIDFEVDTMRVQKDDKQRVKKMINFTPRLQCARLDVPLSVLPPDLLRLEENAVAVAKAQGPKN